MCIRDRLEADNKNVIKLHAGDAISGSLFFTIFKGEADAALMNEICFDAFALGNHEFNDGDKGVAKFIDFLKSEKCNTPVLAANIKPEVGVSALTPNSETDYIQPYTIIERGGIKVGIIGIDIVRKTVMSSSPDETTIFLDEAETAQKMVDEYNIYLEDEFSKSKDQDKALVHDFLQSTWDGFRHANKDDFNSSPKTGVAKKELLLLGEKLSELPDGKKYFRKTLKIFKDRKESFQTNSLDWGAAEMLAYASLLKEGVNIRISGQDVERGTFSHRHAVVVTEDSEEKIYTLNSIGEKQGVFSIYNSLLSEYGVLGFEYGYSLATPKGLTIWEAQFGDFFNGAQIMIDQFISSGEDKWSTQSGLVLLLPHGYEGQGAEHSSARMERFLQQCADLNMQIVNTSTPANHFHLLRRQMKRDFRKPLVVFTPKMLLRHPDATSKLEEMDKGGFQEVIDDASANPEIIDTLVLCSGKFYYEMKSKALQNEVDNMAFIRLEQLYPLPELKLNEVFQKYPNAIRVLWAQEEPANMGAWSYMATNLKQSSLIGITRPATAASAAGSKKLHERRLEKLFDELFRYANVKVNK